MLKWDDKHIFPTKKALNEMHDSSIDLYKVIEILNEGFDCERSKRKKNVIERCKRLGKKILKVVVVDMGGYYKLIHVGKFSIKKGRLK